MLSQIKQQDSHAITDTNLYVLVLPLSIQVNAKLLQKLISGFKRTVIWNKIQPKETKQRQNLYLDHLIDPGFQGLNRLLCFIIWQKCTPNKLQPSKHSFWWRRLEDVFRLRLWKTSSRRLQHVLIKTNIFAPALRLQKTSSRRLAKRSSRHLQDVSSS